MEDKKIKYVPFTHPLYLTQEECDKLESGEYYFSDGYLIKPRTDKVKDSMEDVNNFSY